MTPGVNASQVWFDVPLHRQKHQHQPRSPVEGVFIINPVFSIIFSVVPLTQLENGPHAPVYQLLNLFAYGTYCDYKGIFSGSAV